MAKQSHTARYFLRTARGILKEIASLKKDESGEVRFKVLRKKLSKIQEQYENQLRQQKRIQK